MQSVDDSALLRQFVENHSDEAFAGLVARHINLVYSVALRQIGNQHQAEEITQAVFIILAKKAESLRHDKALSSWLFQTTRLTATNFVRSEMRRHRREQEAYMESQLNESAGEVWRQIAPLLDTAVASLNEQDRRAILLRFYEGRNLREVGDVLGANEEAAKKRVARALEKLRQLFAKRGLDSTADAITGAISGNAIQVAPIGLLAKITSASIAGTTITTTIAMTTIQKIAVAAALTVTVGTGIYEARQAANARAEAQQLRQQQAPMAGQIQQMASQHDKDTNLIAGLKEELAKHERDNLEVMQLRGQIGVLSARLAASKTPAARLDMTALPSNPAQENGPNQAMLDYLGNPIPPPPNLNAAYTREGLINAVQDAAQAANIPLKKVEIEDSEFPFLVGIAVENKDDMQKLTDQIKMLENYKYQGGVSGNSIKAMNIIPPDAYPTALSAAAEKRTMLRESMLYAKMQQQN